MWRTSQKSAKPFGQDCGQLQKMEILKKYKMSQDDIAKILETRLNHKGRHLTAAHFAWNELGLVGLGKLFTLPEVEPML